MTKHAKRCNVKVSAVLVAVMLPLIVPAQAHAHHDEVVDRSGRESYRLVSLSSAGTQGNGDSGHFSCLGGAGGDFLAPSISDGGRYVAFASAASGLHPDDTNGSLFTDVFVRDLKRNDTELISAFFGNEVPPLPPGSGAGCVDMSFNPAISASGRFVAFSSRLPLTGADNENPQTLFGWKVFVHDRKTKETELASVTEITGKEVAMSGDSGFRSVDISDDGRYVAFDNNPPAVDLQDRDPLQPPLGQIYVFDRKQDATTLVSKSSDGAPANAATNKASLSANGRYVVFESTAFNLVDNDLNVVCPNTNCGMDVFLHDLKTKKTELVSVSYNGAAANGSRFSAAPVRGWWVRSSPRTGASSVSKASRRTSHLRAPHPPRLMAGTFATARRDGPSE